MSTLVFGTYAFVKKLTAAGMPEAQAEILAHEQATLIDNRLATKRDIEDVRKEIEKLSLQLTIRLGLMMVVAVGALATIMKL